MEKPVEVKEDGLLLCDDFIEEMMEMYSPVRQKQSSDSKPVMPHPNRSFPVKLLNIMDPLLPTNNLGRSVSKASFARIRKALAHGAKTLTDIMAKVHCCSQQLNPSGFNACPFILSLWCCCRILFGHLSLFIVHLRRMFLLSDLPAHKLEAFARKFGVILILVSQSVDKHFLLHTG